MSHLKSPVSERDHVRGADDAAVVVVEYGDFQCPFCAEAEFRLLRLLQVLGGQVKHVFRHFPLTQVHEYAFAAAMAAEAAGRQGKFWEMHDRLYEKQSLLGPGSLEESAFDLGLNLDAFRTDLLSSEVKDLIKHDFMGGVRSGVNGTPGLFVNGEKYEGPLDAELLIDFMQAA